MILYWLIGCAQAPQEAKNIQLEGKPLNEAIASMEQRLQRQEKEIAEDMLILMNRMGKVESRLKTLEISFTDIRPLAYTAQDISFIPTETKLSATELQSALVEIEKRLRLLEQNVAEDSAQPGSGLFELRDHGKRRTDKGKPKHGPDHQNGTGPKGSQAPPPNGEKGPSGPPPGGGNGPGGSPP